MRTVISVMAALVCAAASAAAQTPGFVYVSVGPGTAFCGANPCTESQVLVFDADTLGLVVRLPLPAASTPVGSAISPDGAHLYVSNASTITGSTQHSLTVIDARRHTVIETYPTPGVAGGLGVRGDDSRVFINVSFSGSPSGLYVFDTTAHAVATGATYTPPISSGPVMVVSPQADRVIVHSQVGLLIPADQLVLFDAGSLAQVASVDQSGDFTRGYKGTGLGLSQDGSQIFVLSQPYNPAHPSTPFTNLRIFDTATLQQEVSANVVGLAAGRVLDHPRGHEILLTSQPILNTLHPEIKAIVARYPFDGIMLGSATQLSFDTFVSLGPLAAGDDRAFFIAFNTDYTLNALDLPRNQVARSTVISASPSPLSFRLVATPTNTIACRYRLDRAYSSWPVSGGAGTIRLTTPCAWEATTTASWVHLSSTTGSGDKIFSITVDPNLQQTASRTATVTIGGQVIAVTEAGTVTQPPFGFIDTPVNGTFGLSGSIPVTGWTLDDVGVSRVRIYRDPVAGEAAGLVFVGDATFVDGARPDVQAISQSTPFASRAGWGYMLLSNMLPNQGNGTFRIHAFADDLEGQTTLLGTSTFTVANAGATLPFGTIDTPGQGETVSGVVTNFGWALTPLPAIIPTDGATIDVLVDGVVVGHPSYNHFRSDVAGLFPGLANSNGAVGLFQFDSRTLTNGLHTISWVVRDSANHTQGIGSRYFTVDNP